MWEVIEREKMGCAAKELVKRNTLKWFDQEERLHDDRLVRKMYSSRRI